MHLDMSDLMRTLAGTFNLKSIWIERYRKERGETDSS